MKTEDLLLLAAVGAGGYLLWKHMSGSAVIVAASGGIVGAPQPPAAGTPGTTPVSVQTGQPISMKPVPGGVIAAPNQPPSSCPIGQVPVDIGDLAPFWTCGTPGSGLYTTTSTGAIIINPYALPGFAPGPTPHCPPGQQPQYADPAGGFIGCG